MGNDDAYDFEADERTAEQRRIDDPTTQPWYCDDCGHNHIVSVCPYW